MGICLKPFGFWTNGAEDREMAWLTCWFLRDVTLAEQQRLVTSLHGGALNLMKFAWKVAGSVSSCYTCNCLCIFTWKCIIILKSIFMCLQLFNQKLTNKPHAAFMYLSTDIKLINDVSHKLLLHKFKN